MVDFSWVGRHGSEWTEEDERDMREEEKRSAFHLPFFFFYQKN